MTSAAATPSAGESFATPNAPYLQYLKRPGTDWTEALELEKILTEAASEVTKFAISRFPPSLSSPVTGSNPTSLPSPSTLRNREQIAAEILDLRIETGGKGVTMTTAACLQQNQVCGKLGANERAVFADKFFHDLQECSPDVHTRIVILQEGMNDVALEILLFCHILGIGLDLRPLHVSNLAQIQLEHGIPVMRDFVALGDEDVFGGHSMDVAAYVGRRQMGSGSPHVVAIHLRKRQYVLAQSVRSLLDSEHTPPLPSDTVSCPATAHRSTAAEEAAPRFSDIIHQYCRLEHQLEKDHPALCWMSALAYVETAACAKILADCKTHRPRPRKQDFLKSAFGPGRQTGSTSWMANIVLGANIGLWQEAKRMELSRDYLAKTTHSHFLRTSFVCATLKDSIRQVTGFRDSHIGLHRSGCNLAAKMLERSLSEGEKTAAEIKEVLEVQHQLKSMETSERTIDGSRSAVAVTVLAFVFIPTSLAASIYGMNVQEINNTGHSIWGFAVTALVMLILSGLAWECWRGWRMFLTVLSLAKRVPAGLTVPLTFVLLIADFVVRPLNRKRGPASAFV